MHLSSDGERFAIQLGLPLKKIHHLTSSFNITDARKNALITTRQKTKEDYFKNTLKKYLSDFQRADVEIKLRKKYRKQ